MNRSVVILSALGSPLLGPVLRTLAKNDVTVSGVLLDGELPARDRERIQSRMTPGYKVEGPADFDFSDVPFYFVKNHNSANALKILQQLKPSYILNAGTPRILKRPILEVSLGVLNCHPGLLPKYRGCTCVEWAIFHNDPVGASVHFMTEGIDEGPVVTTRAMKIQSGESYETVRTRMVEFTAELLAEATASALHANLTRDRMPAQEAGSYFKPISDADLQIVKEKLSTGAYSC